MEIKIDETYHAASCCPYLGTWSFGKYSVHLSFIVQWQGRRVTAAYMQILQKLVWQGIWFQSTHKSEACNCCIQRFFVPFATISITAFLLTIVASLRKILSTQVSLLAVCKQIMTLSTCWWRVCRVVSRFLSSRFYPISRRLLYFHFISPISHSELTY